VRNIKLFVILFMTMILISAPILGVEASVNGVSEKIQFDLSNGVIKNGYFSLPIDKSSEGLIFNLAYIAGYVDEKSNDFIAYSTRVLSIDDWDTKQMVNIPLTMKFVKINNHIVYSYRDQYNQEYMDVPFQLNGKEITVIFLFKGGRGTVAYVYDREGNELTLKNGDILLPIYIRHTGKDTREDVVQEDKKITYNDKLFAYEAPADMKKVAFRIFGQSTQAEGHAYSDVVVPSNFVSTAPVVNNSTSTAMNNQSSPSTWAKADIDKQNKMD